MDYHFIPFRTPRQLCDFTDILKNAKPFVANFAWDGGTIYDLEGYLEHKAAGGDPIYALLDRNIFSRLIQIASGVEVDMKDETLRVAAAAMALLIAAEVVVDPGMAIHEGARSGTQMSPTEELRLFRIADHLHPGVFAEIALGLLDGAPQNELQRVRAIVRKESLAPGAFQNDLHVRTIHHLVLTKVAVLHRESGLAPADRLERLLEWCLNEGLFTNFGSIFATILFSPRSPSKMLKKIASAPPQERLRIVGNTAWDLAYAHEWAKRANKEPNENWILCSNDRTLPVSVKVVVA